MTEEQFILFSAYINNELTREEDAALIELLNSNPNLVQEFEMELMLRQGINKNEILSKLSESTLPGYEAADTYIEQIIKTLEQKEEKGTAVPLTKKYMPLMAAAVFILIIVFAWIYFAKPVNIIVHNKDEQKDTAYTKKDSNAIIPHPENNDHITQKTNGPQLFAQNYSPYSGSEEDPVEISIYLSYYRQKEYGKVIDAQKEDYQTRGVTDTTIALYIELYKALSYLETMKPKAASTILNKILQSRETPLQLFYNAQWFAALAALQQNETATAQQLLEKIKVQKNSPWQMKAINLLSSLNSKE